MRCSKSKIYQLYRFGLNYVDDYFSTRKTKTKLRIKKITFLQKKKFST